VGRVEITRVGAAAVLLTVDDVPAWYADLVRRRDAGEFTAVEIVPAARTVLLDGVGDPEALAAAVAAYPVPAAVAERAGALVTVPTVYDGPDLADVARAWGVAPDEVVRRHTAIEFRVAFCGFAPGFAYLTGLPPDLHLSRRDSPRPKVPAGSVALAGEYGAVYPTASPGGWQLLGRTDLTLFDLAADPPALLAPGTRVRFSAVA
jgi:KipI family sensor histidine kinase inhibitor